jgi:hypothetical protein
MAPRETWQTPPARSPTPVPPLPASDARAGPAAKSSRLKIASHARDTSFHYSEHGDTKSPYATLPQSSDPPVALRALFPCTLERPPSYRARVHWATHQIDCKVQNKRALRIRRDVKADRGSPRTRPSLPDTC